MKRTQVEELIFLWREYATEKDRYLTEGAKGLKREVLLFVEELPSLPIGLANIPQTTNYLYKKTSNAVDRCGVEK